MIRKLLNIAVIAAIALVCAPQAEAQSSVSSGVSRRSADSGSRRAPRKKADRVQAAPSPDATVDADGAFMKVIYRSLDLNEAPNAALYYPETAVGEEENLFHMMMRLLAADGISAYEYLDGREVFNEENRLNVKDMLDRFHILYTPAKGSTEKRPLFTIEESDIPSAEVLGYYIIERCQFDRRVGHMRTIVEAICPVLHRTEEFGAEAVKYPMFWMRYADLQPYLAQRFIFTDDDNNLPSKTFHDYFTLGLYNGEIYKTRNLRNKSMAQLFPDAEERKHAQDSIEERLRAFDKSIYVPSLEELEAQAVAKADAEEAAAADENGDDDAKVSDTDKEKKSTRGKVASKRKPDKKVKSAKRGRVRSANTAVRSVRNRKR